VREKKGKLKTRQRSTDLDLFMSYAEAIRRPCVIPGAPGAYVGNRVFTDLVRCTVMSDSPDDVKDYVELFYCMSVKGLDTSFEGKEDGKGSRERLGESLDTDDRIFRITELENRFDPWYNDDMSMGYRDLALNVEIGWLISNGMVQFQKVRD
jgi:hypothetical protein